MSASVIRVSLHVLGWDDASTSGFSCQLSWGAQITTHHQSDLEATAELSIISTWYSTLDPRLVSLFCLLNKRSALEKGYLPLTAIPSTAAMTGFRTDLMPVHRSSRYRRPRAASASRAEISLMSAPATRTSVSYRKCRGGGTPGVWSRAWAGHGSVDVHGWDVGSLPQKKLLLPVTTMTRTPLSRDASCSCSRNTVISCWERALRLVGRLKARTLTPSTGVEAMTSSSLIV